MSGGLARSRAAATAHAPPLVVAFIVVFLAVNPLVEEIAYRNVAYQAARAGAPAVGAVVLQAVAFGTLHVVGFPAGVAGVGLSFLYGLLLGIIRVMTGGLRVAVIAHAATNATIVALVVLFLLPARVTSRSMSRARWKSVEDWWPQQPMPTATNRAATPGIARLVEGRIHPQELPR